jgi:hypothetical protein
MRVSGVNRRATRVCTVPSDNEGRRREILGPLMNYGTACARPRARQGPLGRHASMHPRHHVPVVVPEGGKAADEPPQVVGWQSGDVGSVVAVAAQ